MGNTNKKNQPLKKMTTLDRFMIRIKVDPKTTCWTWVGAVSSNGYGHININGKLISAHRLSWELFHNEKPGKKFVLHKCDNPLCVNPDHLFLGTNSDNQRDCIAKGRRAKKCTRYTQSTVKELQRLRPTMKMAALAKLFDIPPQYIRILLRKNREEYSLST